ncbi:hypothetical protein CCACVL1_27532 [Corchorus capsularis]|uniref:von Willebrand factor, type A n=1 Tax=Corchorus capsularis TaxID=210143 RepID=A0A1R3G9V7_COCAP|nr:hypothetical protein CCACVL1_27532 [Corchorus capsularis]
MASNGLLLGPPALHPNGDDPMMESLHVGVDKIQLDAIKPIATTKTESSDGANPCLDLFFSALPSTPSHDLVQLLAAAWSFDPLTTLKLVCNLRGIRGTGKSDKESFYTAAVWLYNNHPKTLACNVRAFVEFGCYRDLLEILYRLLEGEKVRVYEKQELEDKNEKKKLGHKSFRKPQLSRGRGFPASRNPNNKETAKERKKAKQLGKAQQAYRRYCTDPIYRLLHDCVSDFFAEKLKHDIRFLNSGEVRKISLASKWCPSIDSAYDKATLICESIARRMFPRESDPEYEGLEEAHYAFRVRDRLRKQVLVPLHKALELPELYMSSKQWDALPYNKVPSVAMKNYKNHFLQHDNKRFKGYIEGVKEDDESIGAGALLPHHIIASLKDAEEVAELQWRKMVEGLKRKGKLINCIAVCDVSKRMEGTSMEVSVALGLLISELSQEPWKEKVVTFGSHAELHSLQGHSLLSKAQLLSKMDGSGDVDLEKVFDRILQVALKEKVEEDKMIKRVFVFSGMGFDEAISTHSSDEFSDYDNPYSDSDSYYSVEDTTLGSDWYFEGKKTEDKQKKLKTESWESMYGRIQMKFQEKGFKMPEIVFWNLNNSPNMAVPVNQGGVALVSGFSKNLLQLFLDNGGIIDPITVMEQAISGELYQNLSVYD